MLNIDRSFDEWYQAIHPQLIAVLVASFGDLGLARECADEACVRALEKWDSVREMSSPNGWAVRVALNVAKRRLRRRTIELRLLSRSVIGDVAGPAGELWHVVRQLPPRQRQAVALRHVTQMTEAEIADVMGISRGGVSSTLRAAYSALKLALNDEEGSISHARP